MKKRITILASLFLIISCGEQGTVVSKTPAGRASSGADPNISTVLKSPYVASSLFPASTPTSTSHISVLPSPDVTTIPDLCSSNGSVVACKVSEELYISVDFGTQVLRPSATELMKFNGRYIPFRSGIITASLESTSSIEVISKKYNLRLEKKIELSPGKVGPVICSFFMDNQNEPDYAQLESLNLTKEPSGEYVFYSSRGVSQFIVSLEIGADRENGVLSAGLDVLATEDGAPWGPVRR